MSLPSELLPVGLLGTGAVAAEAEAEGYTIERSVRFNSADSAYLSRTPASAGNRQAWSWNAWVKRGALSSGNRQVLFGGYGATNDTDWFEFGFETNDTFYWTQSSVGGASTAVFRDTAAWYCIFVSYDGSNIKAFVNNSLILTSAKTGNLGVNGAWSHAIGKCPRSSLSRYFNGYLADVHFIDGQALDPTSFGEFDNNGIWQPKAYTGTYGTNGFHLPFSDNSTAAALGTDTSGNGNTWTVNNISVAAGAGNDSLVDVPTNGTETDTEIGGQVRGNYATLNPLSKGSAVILSDGNLQHYSTDSSWSGPSVALCGFGMTSGKWYWECTISTTTFSYIGMAQIDKTHSYIGGNTNSCGYLTSNGLFYGGGAQAASPNVPYTANATLMFAYDADAKKFWVGQNGTWFSVGGNAGDPANGNYPSHSGFGSSGEVYTPATSTYGTVTTRYNFGQRPFAYTAPSGFKALCTANLPAPVITKPSEYMDVKLYTGNGSTQTISGLEFSPDFVWIKARNIAYNHAWSDTVRGALKMLSSSMTNGEYTDGNGLNSFTSDGWTFNGAGYYSVNESNRPYAAWAWDAGSSTVSNTDGSITSSVRANPSAGFSVVSFTGTSSSGTIGHGLGAAPSMIIIKCRSTGGTSWPVYHQSLGGVNKVITLESTGAVQTISNYWNSSAPSSTTFGVASGYDNNVNGATMIAYCFAPVESYSAFGSYTGNDSADGPFVFTNHRPRWILMKRTDTTSNWTIIDTAREGYNVDNDPLYANLPAIEGTTDLVDILSNGFKLRSADASVNANAGTYIYASFAEQPFQYSRAR